MTNYFSEIEAKGLVGNRVEAKSTLKLVPAGTVGTVVGAEPRDMGWIVQVRWKVQRRSFLNLMVGDACLNLPRRARPVNGELTKSDLEADTKVL